MRIIWSLRALVLADAIGYNGETDQVPHNSAATCGFRQPVSPFLSRASPAFLFCEATMTDDVDMDTDLVRPENSHR